MKKHPNRKRVLRKIANSLRWRCFKCYWHPCVPPDKLRFHIRCMTGILMGIEWRYF